MHQITMDDLQNELKEEFFSYAVILRALVAIKFRIIQQISTTNLLAQLFENTNALKTQRRFK